jgi:hypothetical protein
MGVICKLLDWNEEEDRGDANVCVTARDKMPSPGAGVARLGALLVPQAAWS